LEKNYSNNLELELIPSNERLEIINVVK